MKTIAEVRRELADIRDYMCKKGRLDVALSANCTITFRPDSGLELFATDSNDVLDALAHDLLQAWQHAHGTGQP